MYFCPTEGCNKNLTDQNQHNRKRHIESFIKEVPREERNQQEIKNHTQ